MPYPVQDNQANQNQTNDNVPATEPQVDPNSSTQQIPSSITPAETTTDNTPSVEDIVARASQVGLEADKPQGGADQASDDIIAAAGFDRNQWNAMLEKAAPEQKQQLEAAYKSLQRGADTKFQKAADMLKEAQSLQSQPWTVDRIQSLSKDPNFVQAAQQYAQLTQGYSNPADSGLTEEEYSNLSDSERQRFSELTQNQQQLQNQLNEVLLSQQDEKLKERFKNYDQKVVGGIRQQIQRGEIFPNSEDIWKAVDYEAAIERAYKLGLQDRKQELGQKIEATSVGGGETQITPSGDVPVKEKGENTISFFKRLAQYNKGRVQQAQTKQQ